MKIDGIKVVDAKKPLIIQITKQDVERGKTKDPATCAAARCLLRQKAVEKARVHIGRTYIKLAGKWLRFKTTRALRTEIVAFDRGGTFEPGTYQLAPLSPWERSNGRRQGSKAPGARDKGSKNRTPSKKRKYHIATGIRAVASAR